MVTNTLQQHVYNREVTKVRVWVIDQMIEKGFGHFGENTTQAKSSESERERERERERKSEIYTHSQLLNRYTCTHMATCLSPQPALQLGILVEGS